jgi:Tfp pilus assembly protein PilN
MRFVFIVLLIAIFGYSLGLVLANSETIPVNMPFFQPIPAMNAGLLLLITLFLGIVLGLLLGVQVFRVLQKSWEIRRLKKEIEQLRHQQIQSASAAAAIARTEKVPQDAV